MAENARVMRSGFVIGREMILRKAFRRHTVRALTFIDCLSLTRTSLMLVLGRGQYPRMAQHIRRAACRLSLQIEFVRVAKEMTRLKEVYNPNLSNMDLLNLIYYNPLRIASGQPGIQVSMGSSLDMVGASSGNKSRPRDPQRYDGISNGEYTRKAGRLNVDQSKLGAKGPRNEEEWKNEVEYKLDSMFTMLQVLGKQQAALADKMSDISTLLQDSKGR